MNGNTLEEHNDYHRAYREANKDKLNAQRRINYKSMNEDQLEGKRKRSRKYSNKLYSKGYYNVVALRKWVKKQSDHIFCSICGDVFKPGDIQVDHIISLSKGGTNELTNLQIVCSICNRKKHNSTAIQ